MPSCLAQRSHTLLPPLLSRTHHTFYLPKRAQRAHLRRLLVATCFRSFGLRFHPAISMATPLSPPVSADACGARVRALACRGDKIEQGLGTLAKKSMRIAASSRRQSLGKRALEKVKQPKAEKEHLKSEKTRGKNVGTLGLSLSPPDATCRQCTPEQRGPSPPPVSSSGAAAWPCAPAARPHAG